MPYTVPPFALGNGQRSTRKLVTAVSLGANRAPTARFAPSGLPALRGIPTLIDGVGDCDATMPRTSGTPIVAQSTAATTAATAAERFPIRAAAIHARGMAAIEKE
jgi:hypothetical protein